MMSCPEIEGSIQPLRRKHPLMTNKSRLQNLQNGSMSCSNRRVTHFATAAYPVNSLSQVVDVYRQKIRNDLPGIEGDEVARRKIEEYANRIRPPGFLVSLVQPAF
jgi:maintenance of morphology protein 1